MPSIVPFAARFKRQLLVGLQTPDGVSPNDIDALFREVGGTPVFEESKVEASLRAQMQGTQLTGLVHR